MNDHFPPPPIDWKWVTGLAGALITWLFMLLRDAWKSRRTTETTEQKEFRERLEHDINKLDSTVQGVAKQVSDISGRVRVLEDRSNRRPRTIEGDL